MEIQDALQAFLRQLSADGRSPHTIAQYRRHVTMVITWMISNNVGSDITQVTPDVLAEFFSSDAARQNSRGGQKKAVSVNAMRTSIRCFCAHLHNAGLVAANPARLLRLARCSPPQPRPLHADDQQRLRRVLGQARGPLVERDRMLVELLLGTGIRLGSALALDIEDIDFDHGELALRETKNSRPTTAVLPKAVGRALRKFVGERTSGPVFLGGARRISQRHAQRRLAGWFAEAGIRGKTAHALRHTFATDLLARTGDLRLVQGALNHASIVSTTIYAELDRARLRLAVGA